MSLYLKVNLILFFVSNWSHYPIIEQVKNANPNLGALKEYRKREKEFLDRAKDLEDVTNRRDAQKKKYDDHRKRRLDEFMTGFNTISAKLKEMYQVGQNFLQSIGWYKSPTDDNIRWKCRVGACW